MIELDVRGLNCPEPVIMLKNLIDNGEKNIKVITSYGASASNIERLIKNNKYKIIAKVENENDIIFKIQNG